MNKRKQFKNDSVKIKMTNYNLQCVEKKRTIHGHGHQFKQ
jgi:hypothetical protein